MRTLFLLLLLLRYLVAVPASVDLNISDIVDDPYREYKEVGWCAEAGLQSAFTTYGVYIPQSMINSISNPANHDLYAQDISLTLDRLGFGFKFYPIDNDNYSNFIKWIKEFLSYRVPILFGVHIYPNYTEGILSHFMLAVGYTPNYLIFNSNSKKGKEIESFKNLYNRDRYSFVNRYKTFFAVAIGKTLYSEYAGEVQLTIIKDSKEKATLLITSKKKRDTIYRYRLEYDVKRERLVPLVDSRKLIFSYPKTKGIDIIDRDKAYVYIRKLLK